MIRSEREKETESAVRGKRESKFDSAGESDRALKRRRSFEPNHAKNSISNLLSYLFCARNFKVSVRRADCQSIISICTLESLSWEICENHANILTTSIRWKFHFLNIYSEENKAGRLLYYIWTYHTWFTTSCVSAFPNNSDTLYVAILETILQ